MAILEGWNHIIRCILVYSEMASMMACGLLRIFSFGERKYAVVQCLFAAIVELAKVSHVSAISVGIQEFSKIQFPIQSFHELEIWYRL